MQTALIGPDLIHASSYDVRNASAIRADMKVHLQVEPANNDAMDDIDVMTWMMVRR